MNTNLDNLDVSNNQPKINVELTINEFNTIMAALQELPHRVVDPLLKNLMGQASSQVQQKQV